MLTGNEFAKLFSENEELDERLFSENEESLDELIERAYSEGVEAGYDYAQKEFAMSPTMAVKSGLRKLGRNARVLKEEAVAGIHAGTGKNLTPRDVHALARNQSLALMKNSKVSGVLPNGKPVMGVRAQDFPGFAKSAQVFRRKAAAGTGATSFLGRYI